MAITRIVRSLRTKCVLVLGVSILVVSACGSSGKTITVNSAPAGKIEGTVYVGNGLTLNLGVEVEGSLACPYLQSGSQRLELSFPPGFTFNEKSREVRQKDGKFAVKAGDSVTVAGPPLPVTKGSACSFGRRSTIGVERITTASGSSWLAD
jgi:hypothetical protein